MPVKVFLINLDRDQDRMAAADRQLKALGVEYERLSAVYGKTLPPAEKRRAYNWFRCVCAYGHTFTDGEIGCQLSHQRLYHRMLDEAIPLACVLEDDVVLEAAFPRLLDYLATAMDPQRPQLVLLSNHTAQPVSPPAQGEFGMESSRADMFAESYVITAVAARNLLKANEPMIVPADHFARWVRCGLLELYHAYPTVSRQDKVSFETSTKPSGSFDVRNLSLPLRLLYKSFRVIGKMMDLVLVKIIGY